MKDQPQDNELNELNKLFKAFAQPSSINDGSALDTFKFTRHGIELLSTELQALLNQSRNDLLDELVTDLRDYHQRYPDADYMDILGYIVGTKATYNLLASKHTKQEGGK